MTALFALAAMDAMAINKCVDPSGKVTYQDDKCPDETKKGKVRAAPPSSAEKLPARDDMDDADLNSMAVAVAYMERCGALSPAYARNAAAVMEAYRLKHAASLARYERTKPFQDILRDSRAGTAEIAKNPAARSATARTCPPTSIT